MVYPKAVFNFGLIVALPVPVLLMYAESWTWIIAANILLGINQGLAWSSTVSMKRDLVGEKTEDCRWALINLPGTGLLVWRLIYQLR